MALTSPHPSKDSIPDDSWYFVANPNFLVLTLAPFGLLTLHACTLAYFYSTILPIIDGHGKENHLNTSLISWSAATSLPLALIICIGVPIRLVSFASLGKNFTIDLAVPNGLITYDINQYLQHPSYTGSLVLVFSNTMLLLRIDGAFSCWIPSKRYRTV